MKTKTAILTIGIVFLLLAVAFPVSAEVTNESAVQEESALIENFMNQIEQAASDSTNFDEFLTKITSLIDQFTLNDNPVIQTIIQKIVSWIFNDQGLFVGGNNLGDLLKNLKNPTTNERPDKFVISYGSYNRLNPKKENTFKLFKERISFWHYGGKTNIFKGKTLIIQRRPFEIKQSIHGPQFGYMKNFRGLYIDMESKLTGNSYIFFIGRAQAIRAFDLTPFSK